MRPQNSEFVLRVFQKKKSFQALEKSYCTISYLIAHSIRLDLYFHFVENIFLLFIETKTNIFIGQIRHFSFCIILKTIMTNENVSLL